jgi:hypothetical protein
VGRVRAPSQQAWEIGESESGGRMAIDGNAAGEGEAETPFRELNQAGRFLPGTG